MKVGGDHSKQRGNDGAPLMANRTYHVNGNRYPTKPHIETEILAGQVRKLDFTSRKYVALRGNDPIIQHCTYLKRPLRKLSVPKDLAFTGPKPKSAGPGIR